MTRKAVSRTIAFIFILLFLYAAMSKLLDYDRFYGQIKSSPLIGAVAGFIAWSVPAVEVAVVALLCIERTRLRGLQASLGLMLMFTVYISFILLFSANIPCSCGGVLESLGWVEHLILNFVLVLLAFLGILVEGRPATTASRFTENARTL